MDAFRTLFPMACPIIGMIHLDALPGTPANRYSVEKIFERALKEAKLYKSAGIDALMIENMHDAPYICGQVGPEITSCMAVIAREIKQSTEIPCGLQILAAANREALACAQAAGLDFIRAEGFVFSHIGDEGPINACAGDLLRYRRQIGAEQILVFADMKKKHSSHAITADVNLAETVRAAEFFRADGAVITGIATGMSTSLEDVRIAREASRLPVLVGSGVTLVNVEDYLDAADGLIVGSWFKREGRWDRPVDGERVRTFMDRVRAWRN